jgi:hypothetical protein
MARRTSPDRLDHAPLVPVRGVEHDRGDAELGGRAADAAAPAEIPTAAATIS